MPESHPENLPKIARYKPYYEELEADKRTFGVHVD